MNLNIESISPTTLAIDTILNNKKKKRKNIIWTSKNPNFPKLNQLTKSNNDNWSFRIIQAGHSWPRSRDKATFGSRYPRIGS